MSRFLPDDLFVGAEKGRLSFVRRSRGFQPRVVATFALTLPEKFWESPDLDWIRHSLPEEVMTGVRANIVIADRLVRYFLVERPQGARSVKELELAAELRFEELYGEDAQPWKIKMDLSPWAPNFLACSMPDAHLVLLQQLFALLHIPVRRISSFGIEEWNRQSRRLHASNVCFVALSKDTAWLTLRRDQRWLAAYVHSLHDDSKNELPGLIRREFVRHGLQDQWGSQSIYIAGAVDDQISNSLTNHRMLSAAFWHDPDQLQSETFRLALSSVWPICN